MVGALLQQTHSFMVPSLLMAACLFASGCLVFLMPRLLTLPPSVLVGLLDPKPGVGYSGWIELGKIRE